MSNTNLTIGIIGLGKMGEAIAYRLLKANHKVFGFDPNEQARKDFENIGGKPIESVEELGTLVNIVWIMVPAGKPVDDVLEKLSTNLKPNSIIVDGGNSHFPDTVRRAKLLKEKNVFFLDCGTSGGLKGREIGFSLMIGGEKEIYEKIEPVFKAIAAPSGYDYMGPSGAGHYVKMVHNGIEYALLQSYADGFALLKNGKYENLDLAKIADVWSHGSVIRSWIAELSHDIFSRDQELTSISGEIGENLTGQWTLQEAKEQKVSFDLLKLSLEIRAESRKSGGNYSTKIVAMLRNAFGGHPVKKI